MDRMKKNEKKIAITFAIMFVVGFIINGFYSVISLESSFFNLEVTSSAIFVALCYLLYAWMLTRKNLLLTALGVLSILLITVINDVHYYGVATPIMKGFHWNTIVLLICDLIAIFITIFPIIMESKDSDENIIEDNAKN